ncbi:MAG TPA: 3-oxoadipate enol-lactonase [Candidatus Sulfotelmatobacter sp.]|nr:3-oxoadipate enol-lactonase [Candidatus Sulfotelmatobacter sp.]
MPFVRVDDLVVHYDLTGPADAPVIVFGNSLGTSYDLWDDNVGALCDRYRVLRLDMRGHGLTSITPGTPRPTIDAVTQDVVELLEALSIGRVRYVGLSIGGMIGQRLAATHPERLEALVLCATGNQLSTPEIWNARIASVEAGGIEAIADGTMQRWFAPSTHRDRADTIAGFRNMLVRTPQPGYIDGCKTVRDADLRADDARITTPTLIISGAQDQAAPVERGQTLHAAIASSQFVVVDDAGHLLNVEQPDRVNRLLNAFLAEPTRAVEAAR